MPSSPHLLLIEDDPGVREALSLALELHGYRVSCAPSGNQGLKLLKQQPDLVVLDVLLPDLNGFEVLKSIRSQTDLPVLMLTALDEVEWRVRGLKGGADDYLVKPYALSELLARIEAVLRRTRNQLSRDFLAYEDLTLDREKMQATRQGRPLDLSFKGLKLLEVFLQHPERVLSREALMQGVWGEDVENNTLEVQLSGLRRALGDPPLVHTLRGYGYVLRKP
ncbi:response regulator transcription factor [Deinococcus cellulosilyticus]|uniref:DNA-binding response regulator n=1 Tax=Deinococcus cellulosilyticus (strain DSM 18568 / NBRC 106333 / KACC 11606 / 5516J-15) TaxID=1223518 RepID=A0A511N0K0_DEIC1|nr:response regulator transcription factor [Deinococcus cellulosilyticus]GEM46349.1 DNA-binding response regulator [Deinococcus cellulosilyticus NBRC 106333 = KACC 11606]